MFQPCHGCHDTLWWTNILQWKITIINGKIHYFDWAIFHCKLLVHQRVITRMWMGMELRWNSRRRFSGKVLGLLALWKPQVLAHIKNCSTPSADIHGFLGKMLGKPEHLRKRHHFVIFFPHSSWECGVVFSPWDDFPRTLDDYSLPHCPFFRSVNKILLLCKFVFFLINEQCEQLQIFQTFGPFGYGSNLGTPIIGWLILN